MHSLQHRALGLFLLSNESDEVARFKRRSQHTFTLFVATWAASLATGAFAQQSYPNRPLRIVVPSSTGNDFSTRILAQPLSERLGQQVVVDNRAGAATMIGTEIVAKSIRTVTRWRWCRLRS